MLEDEYTFLREHLHRCHLPQDQVNESLLIGWIGKYDVEQTPLGSKKTESGDGIPDED